MKTAFLVLSFLSSTVLGFAPATTTITTTTITTTTSLHANSNPSDSNTPPLVQSIPSFMQKMGVIRADQYQTWLPADINADDAHKVVNRAPYQKSTADETNYQSPYGVIIDPDDTNLLTPDHGNR